MIIAEPLFTGKNKIYMPEMVSTNAFATELLSKTNPSEGTCIITDFQTAGRGQIGRSWFSDPGQNVLISYILYPKFIKISDQFYLNIISGLAVRDVVSMSCPEAKIKWPNDIYVGNQKIAGILVQNTLQGTTIKSTIIGMGLNVNQKYFSPELPNPTSLHQKTKIIFDISEIIGLLSARLEYHYLRMLRGQTLDLLTEYTQLMYRLEQWSRYSSVDDESTFEAKITGIDDDGYLVLCHKDMTIHSYGFRQIRYII
ncbi:MAG: biotin--[acetyl-CoA-carboxylase] ligase [Saprospiraceae bacterium]